jgi:hypothetical protein
LRPSRGFSVCMSNGLSTGGNDGISDSRTDSGDSA